LRWQVRDLQEKHEAKVSKLRDKREQLKQTLTEAQENFNKEISFRLLDKEKYVSAQPCLCCFFLLAITLVVANDP
jgi:hypothetical protein